MIQKATGVNSQTRMGFFVAGISLVAMSLFSWLKKEDKKPTVKLLSRDGKLVEVDLKKLNATGQLASREEVQNWIKR
jgi:hypothetical protein